LPTPTTHPPHAAAAPSVAVLELAALRRMKPDELCALAERLGVDDARDLRRQELVLAVLEAHADRRGETHAEGILEILPDGFGFLRSPEHAYQPGVDDIYVSPSQIRRFGMRTGDAVRGTVRAPKETERYFALLRVEAIEGGAPDQHPQLVDFDDRIALPAERSFQFGAAPPSVRLADLYCPLGFGQRIVVKAPPRAGKTALLADLARAIHAAHPDVATTLCAVDLRPEDATELERALDGLVVVSTMADPPARHVQLVELVLERAKRAAERGKDAVVLIDSLGRLARAVNVVHPPSGRSLVGALDAVAVGKVKRWMSAARRLESGGSLTIVATLATDSGGRIDDILADELHETGAVELVLDRAAAGVHDHAVIDPATSSVRHAAALLGDRATAWRTLMATPPGVERALAAMAGTASRAELVDRLTDPDPGPSPSTDTSAGG
jgi:transcription termination factor Rho